ncbi:hypothetical protein [Enterococcus xiangfangensis]|uniref:hypothetical protein n=1 Tax=Enterococcus xiangfangensis TaxID=1296537 RepID=UPI003D17EA39|nr:hypothetical protein [Enterococcus asini]
MTTNLDKLKKLAEELNQVNLKSKAKIISVELDESDENVRVQFTFYSSSFDYISMKKIDDTFTNYCIGFFGREYYLDDEKLSNLEKIEAEKYGLNNAYLKTLYFSR